MKYYSPIILFACLAIGQVEYVEDFLSNPNKLKLLKNYNLIKPELDKMLKNYKEQINFDNFWQEKHTVTVYTGSVQRNLEAINRELEYYMENGLNGVPYSQWSIAEKKIISDRVEAKYTGRSSEEVQKSRNKIIKINQHLYSKSAEWIEIVEFLGGYSKLGELGFTKNDAEKFKISAKLTKIELISPTECLGYVEIYGDPKYGLKFHKIEKTNYKYKGTYNIPIKANYYSLLGNDPTPLINFSFEEKEHMPALSDSKTIGKLLPTISSSKVTILTMFEDLVSASEIPIIFPESLDKKLKYRKTITLKDALGIRPDFVEPVIKKYENYFGSPSLKKDIIAISLNDAISKIETYERKQREEEKRIFDERERLANQRKIKEIEKRKAYIKEKRFFSFTYGLTNMQSNDLSSSFRELNINIFPFMVSYGWTPEIKIDAVPDTTRFYDGSFWITTGWSLYNKNSFRAGSITYDLFPDFFLRPFIGFGLQRKSIQKYWLDTYVYGYHIPDYEGDTNWFEPMGPGTKRERGGPELTSSLFFEGAIYCNITYFQLSVKYRGNLSGDSWNRITYSIGIKGW